MNPEDEATVRANVQKLVAAGAPEQDIHDYLEASGYPQQGTPTSQAPRIPTKLEIARRNASMPHPEDNEAPDPTYLQQALGGISSLARDIPGGEAAQAGARSLLRGQSYTDALSDIRGAEDSAPGLVRNYNRVTGGILSGAAIPGSTALAGARYGVGDALLSSDPSSLKDRLDTAAWKAPVDAALGKVLGDMAPQAVRSIGGKALDRAALLRQAAIRAFDNAAYGKAATEGTLAAANPLPQVVSDTFNDPDVKPFVDAVTSSSVFKGASPGKIISEAYKLMSERQGKLGAQITNSADYKAGTAIEHAEITSAKQKLLNAADQIMPSFRSAVQGHAELAGQRDAFETARDATSNILKGKSGATKNLETKSPAAFMQSILEMTPQEAQAARQGLLGQMKESMPYTPNPLKIFGLPKATLGSSRIAPYLNALDKQTGGITPSLLRGAAVSAGGLLSY